MCDGWLGIANGLLLGGLSGAPAVALVARVLSGCGGVVRSMARLYVDPRLITIDEVMIATSPEPEEIARSDAVLPDRASAKATETTEARVGINADEEVLLATGSE